MVTVAELTALVEILNRCPVTAAERIWLQSLVEKLTPKPVGVQTEPAEAKETK
jgi:hypothetical protein